MHTDGTKRLTMLRICAQGKNIHQCDAKVADFPYIYIGGSYMYLHINNQTDSSG